MQIIEESYAEARALFPFAGLIEICEVQTAQEFAARFVGQLLKGKRLPPFEQLSNTHRYVYAYLIATLEQRRVDPRFARKIPRDVTTLIAHVKTQLATGSPRIIAPDLIDPIAHLQDRSRVIHGRLWSEHQIAKELQRIAQVSATLGGEIINDPRDLIAFLQDYPLPDLWHQVMTGAGSAQLHFGVKHFILSQPDCDFGTMLSHFKDAAFEDFLPTLPNFKARITQFFTKATACKSTQATFGTQDRIETVLFYQMLQKAMTATFTRFACDPGYDYVAMLQAATTRIHALEFKGKPVILRALSTCANMPFDAGNNNDIAQASSDGAALVFVGSGQEHSNETYPRAAPAPDETLAQYKTRVRDIDDEFSLERMEAILSVKLPLEYAPAFRTRGL